MKKLLFGLLGLVVVAVAAALIGPSFVDWNAHKGRITAEARKLTGRALTIDGDISLAILPAPALSASNVRLANIEGGSEPAMAALKELEIRVALMPLLQGDVQVESISLVEPKIFLEVLPDGRRNWQFDKAPVAPGADDVGTAAPSAEDGQEAVSGDGLAGQISLDSFTIRGGTLVYRNALTGTEERLEAVEADIVAESLNGPFAASGSARLRGVDTDFEATLGRLLEAGATPVNVGLRLPAADATVQFGGAFSTEPKGAFLRGRLKAEGGNLAALAASLSANADLPPLLAKSFALETELTANPEQIHAAEVTLRLDELPLTADIVVAQGDVPNVQISVAASQLDLDKLLSATGQAKPAKPASQAPSDGEKKSQTAAQAETGFVIPKDIKAALTVTVDTLVYREQVVRQVKFEAGLAGGQVSVKQAAALLPGGSDVSLSGTIAPDGQNIIGFDGRVEAASDNLRSVLTWLGADVSAVDPGRLRKASLSSRIKATPAQVTFGNLDLRVDVSRITGGITAALRARPGFGIGLSIDKLNLDAYLPRDAGGGQAKAQANGQTTAGAQDSKAATPGGLAVLKTFDANLDLKVGALTVQGSALSDLRLDATLQQGAVDIRDLRIGEFAGSSASAAGKVTNLETNPAIDGRFNLKVSDPLRLGKATGDETGALAKLGPFDLGGTAKGTMAQVAFDTKLAALGGKFGFSGTAQPQAAPLGFDITVTAEHPNLANLAKSFADDLILDPSLGGVAIKARVAGTPLKVAVTGIAGKLGPADLAGSLNADLSGPSPVVTDAKLSVGIEHPNVATLVGSFSPQVALNPDLGAISLNAQVAATPSRYDVTGLTGKIGQTDLSGALSADLSGAKPMITADLKTGVLPAAALLAPAAAGSKKSKTAKSSSSSGGVTGSGGRAAAGTVDKRWSRAPIDLTGLNAVNADVKITSDALLLGDVRLDSSVVDASLKDGVLSLRKFNGTLYEGAFSMVGKVDARSDLKAGLSITTIEMNMRRLLRDIADTKRISGPLSVNAQLSTRGSSEADLVSALSGKGDLNGTLKVKAKAEEQIGSILLGVLGTKVKEIRGVADATSVLFSAFAGAPAAVTGTFVVENGVVKTTDTRIVGRNAKAITQGTVALPAWQMATQTDVFREQDPNTPYLTTQLRGPLDKPNVKVSGQPFQRQQQAPAAGPAPTGPAPTGTQQVPQPQQQQKKLKPEDVLKKGLKDLLKGLGN